MKSGPFLIFETANTQFRSSNVVLHLHDNTILIFTKIIQNISTFSSPQAVVFSNPEEELIVSESELCIDYDVSGETDNDTGGDMPVVSSLKSIVWYGKVTGPMV